MVIIAPVVLTVVIVAQIAEQSDSYTSWVTVFAALLIMGTSGAFIAVCVAALVEGGPSMMANLIVVSSLFQFALAARLSLLRRIFTPTVAGTVIMLIAATVMPLVFDMLTEAPDDASSAAAPATALATLVVIAALVLRAPPALRLWSPLIGIAAGCSVAAFFGLYNARQVLEAPWIGVPLGSWPGLDLTPSPEFWALLPAFVVVTLVGAIETIGDGVAIQRVSRRRPRATDFRVVQGTLNADGVGNLLSGIAGAPPTRPLIQRVACRGYRSRGTASGSRYRRGFRGAGVLPQGCGLVDCYPRPRGGRLCHCSHCAAVRAGDEDHRPRRRRSPEGRRCGTVVLDRRGVSEPVDLRGPAGRRILGRVARQRHDFGRSRRCRHDDVRGADGASAQASGGRIGHGRLAEAGRVPSRVRVEGWMER